MPGTHIGRRALLGAAAGLAATAAIGPGGRTNPASAAATASHAVYLVPGYRADAANHRGMPASDSPELRRSFPAGYQGGITLLTRIDERDGSLRRALLPVTGHHIAIAPNGRGAVFSSMNGPGFAVFDPESLDLAGLPTCHSADFIAGGHSAFSADGALLVTIERRRYELPASRIEERYGRLVLRDPRSFAVLASYSSHGVGPHDVRLTADGKHAVVANYGSINRPKPGEAPSIVEPCVAALELASGRLIYKGVSPVADGELRHLAADRLDRIAALCVRQATGDEARALAAADPEIDESDPSFAEGIYYKPCPLARFDATVEGAAAVASLPPDPRLARYAQSMIYDPVHDEIIVTYASSHALAAFDAASGAVKRVIRTDRLGLRFPRGIELHPDGSHYVVSGSWQGLYQFRRGAHELAWDRCRHAVFFEHSHLTLTAA